MKKWNNTQARGDGAYPNARMNARQRSASARESPSSSAGLRKYKQEFQTLLNSSQSQRIKHLLYTAEHSNDKEPHGTDELERAEARNAPQDDTHVDVDALVIIGLVRADVVKTGS